MEGVLPISPSSLAVATLLFAGFLVFLFLAALALPGPVHDGALIEGQRKRYRLNGFATFLSLAAALFFLARFRGLSLFIVHRHFLSLLVVANVFAFGLTFFLYRKGTQDRPSRSLSDVVKGLFYGTEINPEVFGLDLKMFSYRPSLIGLGLLNVSFAFAQQQIYGHVTARMWLFQVFYFLYLANYFQFEYGMLYTWDIIAEKFGWMLVWGDYVLVPFFYSLPGWFLLHNLAPISTAEIVALCALYLFGFTLFRGANEQKHRYKMDPAARIWGKPAEAIGGKLLVSGFWGIGRKLNYTGELCMYYAWTLPCGFGSLWPFLLPLWLTLFFPHRAWRDEQRCSAKYGPLWTAYCQRARFRMIPFLY
jgi:delta14-sterol reductase